MSRPRTITSLILIALFGSLVPLAAVAREDGAAPTPSGTIDVGGDYNDGKPLPLVVEDRNVVARTAPGRARIGQVKTWLALDDEERKIYPKRFKLRGVGRNIEVWVATGSDEVSTGLQFPAGDCRNERVKVTDKQIRYLIDEFDDNIYPKESRAFSVPPRRNGSDARLPRELGLPKDYYRGRGDRIVTLIDNVRDDHFYDTNNSGNLSFIAGFFYSLFNDAVDRNVMTIDAYDWEHRTGANPPNEPVPGDLCASAPARPYGYEGVFAHEYQHLLEFYEDPFEATWVNEGLSDWAMNLTNYTDPRIPPTATGFDGHVWGFLGYLGVQTPANPNPRGMGPENSLTWWEDQGQGEVLADYGAAFTITEFLRARYGKDFITRVHRANGVGFAGLRQALRDEDTTATPLQLVHQWLASMALDGVLDDNATLTGGEAATYRVGALDASINWDTEHAYASPGAPPNGADFVRLRNADGSYLGAGQVTSLEFTGSKTLPPFPVEWTVDENPPGHANDPALYSGSGADFDRAIVQEVNVPQNDPTLSFETRYEIEEFWDFGVVQVSTDDGKTWTSLSNPRTTSEVDEDAIPLVKQNLPGFTGTSGCAEGTQTSGSCTSDPAWVTETFNLAAYAGQKVLLSFRYLTDPGVDMDGWWIDDVKVGNQNVSNGQNLTGWRSGTEVNPAPVSGWTVQLVAYDDAHSSAWLYQLPLDSDFRGALSGTAVTAALGSSAQTVGAIVTYDEPTELVNQYARYTLTVNGVTQPGG